MSRDLLYKNGCEDSENEDVERKVVNFKMRLSYLQFYTFQMK